MLLAVASAGQASAQSRSTTSVAVDQTQWVEFTDLPPNSVFCTADGWRAPFMVQQQGLYEGYERKHRVLIRGRWQGVGNMLCTSNTTRALVADVEVNVLEGEVDFDGINLDFRSLPALGFFPVGGSLRVKNNQLASYLAGPALDIFNVSDGEWRATVLNLSGYLVGLHWSTLDPDDPTRVFNLAYMRMGPHYRSKRMLRGLFSLGTQAGYGFLIRGDTEKGVSLVLHGVDLSITFTWFLI